MLWALNKCLVDKMLLPTLLLSIAGAPCSLLPPLLTPAMMLQCLGRAHQVPTSPPTPTKAFPSPWSGNPPGTGFSHWPLSAGLGLAPLLWGGGNWARPGSPTHRSLFLRWLNVCFQIPEACVTPTSVPAGLWPGLPWLPSSPCWARLVCRVGCQATALFPAAPQLGPEP